MPCAGACAQVSAMAAANAQRMNGRETCMKTPSQMASWADRAVVTSYATQRPEKARRMAQVTDTGCLVLRPLVLRVRKPIPRGDGRRAWGGPALRLQLSPRPHGRADADGNGERRSTLFAPHCGGPDRSGEQRSSLFAPHCADSDRSGEARVNSGASFTVPVGVSTLWRTRGKLAAVRRAAPRPGRHPRGGSAHVLVRRGVVMRGVVT